MTPAKRRPATPAGQGPTRTASDLPAAPPDVPPTAAQDDSQLLGPHGEPITETAVAQDDGGDSAGGTETGHVDAEGRATSQSPRRRRSLYPLPVWPD